ncbi:MAG: hypothetical protein EBR82_68315, partial [Caulobacteraceae bacterium]|nr:hypothetical protein [Caulobacteraceae bacterium]
MVLASCNSREITAASVGLDAPLAKVHTLWRAAGATEALRIFYGVAVITEGPALGHGMFVDQTTLAQVMEQAKTYTGGLKVKLDHNASASEIVGYLTGFRVEGTTVRADLHLLRSSPRREYIIELAETIPDTFGLSIAFSGTDEKIGENWFARCAEIYSADIVSEPAANPSGLFQAGETQPTPITDMNPEDLKAALDAALAPILERISAIETAIAADTATDIAEQTSGMQPNVELVKSAAKEAALSVLREFNAALPAPVKFSAPAVEPK